MQREQLQSWQPAGQAELVRISTEPDQTQTAIERLHLKLYQAQLELKQAKERVIAMETSKFWKLRRLWFRFKAMFGIYEPETPVDPCLLAITETTQKQNPVPFMTARYIDVPMSRDNRYQNWLNRHYPRGADFHRMAETSKVLRDRP